MELDYDRDGKIDAEDILRFFGGANRFIDCNDLEKIIKDSGKSKDNNLSYNEFCTWMGNAIQV